MASKPFAGKVPAQDTPGDAEEKRALKSIQRAKTDRSRHQSRITDCYRFAMPWRHGFLLDQATVDSNLDQVFASTAMTVTEDFASEMASIATPERDYWVKSKPLKKFGKPEQTQLEKPLAEYDASVFAEITRSTFYQASQPCYRDFSVGTMAMCIKDIGISEPILCEAIPAPELLLERGPRNGLDGIWREWPLMKGSDIRVTWPDAKRPITGEKFKADDSDEYRGIVDGVYRDWSTPTVERWVYLVLQGGKKIYREQYEGKGSCPFVVARWSLDSTTAWGIGGLYAVISDVKVENYIQEKELKALDKAVDPVTSYTDDGVMNIDNGVEPGDWIPRGTNSDAPEAIESKAHFDVSFAKRDDLVHNIKRALFQDRPEQEGKTPPTAYQWSDERAERARRMSTPLANIVQEWQYAIFRRFAWLMQKRNALPKVELNGEEIALEPVSEMLRAQDQAKALRSQRLAEIITQLFGPQIASVAIKVPEFTSKMAELLDVDPDLVASKEELTAAIAQLGQILGKVSGGGQAGAPPAEPAPV